jgi:hypothetical protein
MAVLMDTMQIDSEKTKHPNGKLQSVEYRGRDYAYRK